ncbi:MAG: AMP-binding protein, partial [Acidimicrobiales bacterium]
MNIGLIPQKWARLTPQKEAVIDAEKNRRITFSELEDLVNQIANGLISIGLQKGDRVGILSKNSIEHLALFYACGRVGLVAQPMNWRLSASELVKIIGNGNPSVVIVDGDLSGLGKQVQAETDLVQQWLEYGEAGDQSFESLVQGQPPIEPSLTSNCRAEDPFFILYTGGTTGESKGALHSHESVWYGMQNQTVAERIVPSDVYMLTGQMFHIPIVLAMNYHAHGCPLVLMNFDAELALNLIQEERVSAFLGVTTM